MTDEKPEGHGPDDEQRRIAAKARQWFGVDDQERIDVVACIKSGQVWTVRGTKRLVLEIVADAQMFGNDALTTSGGDWASVRVAASVFKDALLGRPRPLMTLAHELGHIVNCHPIVLARVAGANESTPMSSTVRKWEIEAKRFASLFLLKRELVARYETVKEIMEKFGVSEQAADICLKEINKKRSRPQILEGFAALRDALGRPGSAKNPANNNIPPNPPKQNEDFRRMARLIGVPCICTWGQLVPAGGSKYRCEDCGYVGELPDGDSYGT